jgi:hypothetical protein
MTWVIGTTSVSGDAILASDVCVTFTSSTGQSACIDCLQKIYPLGRFVVGGFAGSVRIGFSIMEALTKRFNEIPETHAVDLNSQELTTLTQIVKEVFELSPLPERELGCAVILGWVHPICNRDGMLWHSPWSCIYTLSYPEFQVVSQDIPFSMMSIGSGSFVPELVSKAQEACSASPVISWEGGGRMGAAMLAILLSKALKTIPYRGVSTFFHIGAVTRGERVGITHHDSGDTRFPEVSRTYAEFEIMCRKLGMATAGAVA